jgi:hypothetical protein
VLLELGGKVVVVPMTLACGVNGPVLTATAGTTTPGCGGATSPAKTQRASLGQLTSVRLIPRSFAMLDHETACGPAGPPGLSQLGWVDSAKAAAPALASDSGKSVSSHAAEASSLVNRPLALLYANSPAFSPTRK